MSFITGLLGAAKPAQAPVPAAPTLSSGQVVGADIMERERQRKRYGTDQTILAGGLGDTGKNRSDANVSRTTLLGGNA